MGGEAAMTVKAEELVVQNLPTALRRAGPGTAVYSLCSGLGVKIEALQRLGRRVLMSRFLDSVSDIADAQRLVQLFDLQPWEGEVLDAYRDRLQVLVPLYLQGALSAPRLLQLLAVAFKGTLTAVGLPNPFGLKGRPQNDAYTTTGELVALMPGESGPVAVPFTAAVLDAPLLPRQEQTVQPTLASGFMWELTNKDEVDAYQPVIQITAGSNPVVAPILVQRDLRRFLLVNRVIPAGATLQVNMLTHKIREFGGSASSPGPVRTDDGQTPDLIYGAGGVVDDPLMDSLPFPIVAWWTEPRQPELPLVSAGTSHWRLLAPADRTGAPVAADDTVALGQMRTRVDADGGEPAAITFRWQVERQYGAFSVVYRSPGQQDWWPSVPIPAGDWLDTQRRWFDAQTRRLMPAGVQRLDPNQIIL